MGVYTYDIIESEFYITEEDFEKIYNKDGFTIYGNKKLDKERELNAREPIKTFNDFGDACLELEKHYPDEIWFVKDGYYKVIMYWIDEDDGYNGGELVEQNDKFDIVVPKPELDKSEIIEQLISLGENACEYTEQYSDSEVFMKDVVAISFAIDTIKKYVNSEV